jgi:hypothetical protein
VALEGKDSTGLFASKLFWNGASLVKTEEITAFEIFSVLDGEYERSRAGDHKLGRDRSYIKGRTYTHLDVDEKYFSAGDRVSVETVR